MQTCTKNVQKKQKKSNETHPPTRNAHNETNLANTKEYIVEKYDRKKYEQFSLISRF